MSEPGEAPPAGTAPRRGALSDFSILRILAKEAPRAGADPARGGPPASQRGAELARRSSAFAPQNKLDWLRQQVCRARQQQQQQTPKVEAGGERATRSSEVESSEAVTRINNSNGVQFNNEELAWLRCTRYCPPKLPRKSSEGKSLKRKPGAHPRIPFTSYQLEVLNDKYKNNAYLSRKDVAYLSDLLHLHQNRIKIWFQNRRARDRRESLR